MFVRNEGLKGFFKYYPITSVIVVINSLVMFSVLLFFDGWSNPQVVFNLGGISHSHITQGEYWRLLTYSFLHLGLYHFLFNNLFLIIFAPGIERLLGKTRYLVLFFVTVFVTSLFIIFLTSTPGVGSSGFFFGILAIYNVFIVTNRFEIGKINRKLIIYFTMLSFIGTIFFSLFTQQLVTTMGHIGGFIGGVFCGLIFSNIKLYREENTN